MASFVQTFGSSMERTLGDGIDSSLLKLIESSSAQKDFKKPVPRGVATFAPIEPKCQVFNLKPVYVAKERKHPKYLIKKPKEPKFVPYEPYKAAVEPIVPHKVHLPSVVVKSSKNNVEIQELVTQMAEIRSTELNKANKDAIKKEELFISRREWEKEKLSYETDIKNLRESTAHLENQIKFQTQVNSELKTLLVAAVGEDLESRVQHLTEDKLQLARALLNSANHLTSHQEQTEWLSGQCEVWRSKFLASSLMVEELAHWKSALSARITELQKTVTQLLDERQKVQTLALKTLCFLQVAAQSCGHDFKTPQTTDILELSNKNYHLCQTLNHSLTVDKEECDNLFEEYTKLPPYTCFEKMALRLLRNPVTISNKQDAICNALMGTAMSLSGEQIYLKYPSNQATCCSHCVGEVKNI